MGFLHGMGEQVNPPPGERPEAPRVGGHPPTPPPGFSYDAPTQPIPTTVPITELELPDQGYDPTQPNQAPIAGIDLITFAVISRRLLDTPVGDHEALLAAYDHTPASWSAVNTAWIARLGQMPFLFTTYTAAYRAS